MSEEARSHQSTRVGLGFIVVAALWLLGASIVIWSGLLDWRERPSSPEAPLRTYLGAVTNGDLQVALLEIDPAARPTALPFVLEQLGNQYRVLGVGTRQPSLLDRVRGIGDPNRALLTVQLDTTLITGETWRTTTHVPMVRTADGWYLARAPLQPAAVDR